MKNIDVLISSRNPDKIKEIKEIMANLPVHLISALDYGDLPQIEEDADTLLGNAMKKANIIAAKTGITTISDDTGLFVDALNGQPGVESARYAGEQCSYQDNRNKLLKEMQGVDKRTAKFITVAVLVTPDNKFISAEGWLEGLITHSEIGENGFGYDSVFIIPEDNQTLAEMTSEEKNRISHRGRAFRNLAEMIEDFI